MQSTSAQRRPALHIGMTRRQAYSALGLPAALDRSFVDGCERQQWIFRDRRLRLFFEGDELAAWHSSGAASLETMLRGPRRSGVDSSD